MYIIYIHFLRKAGIIITFFFPKYTQYKHLGGKKKIRLCFSEIMQRNFVADNLIMLWHPQAYFPVSECEDASGR